MKQTDIEQLNKIVDDIESIKSVLRKNAPLFKTLVAPDNFKRFSLIIGIMLLVIPAIYYYFMRQYGSYAQIPSVIKTIMLFVVAFIWVVAAVLKQLLWYLSLGKSNREISYRRAMSGFFTAQIIHLYIPVLLTAVVLIGYFYITKNTYYIIPASAIGAAIIYNVLGTISDVWQYLVTGYWFLISGIILLFNPISAPIAVMACFGVGFILFAIVSIRRISASGRA